jgi:DNA-binding NarL/FixJ family response regulator
MFGRAGLPPRRGRCENVGVSLVLVEHATEAVADSPSPAVARLLSRVEAEADALEAQAAELRLRAQRLADKARHLRARARQLRESPRSTALSPNDWADLHHATRVGRRTLPVLTPRQREIARLIACGRTNRQIAQELVITVGTAANHVAQVLDRLGLENRAQLAAWAVEHREVWHDPTMGT